MNAGKLGAGMPRLFALRARKGRPACPVCPMREYGVQELSSLVNRKRPLVQLHDGAVDSGGVDASNAPGAAAAPAAVALLRPHQVIEHLGAIAAPGSLFPASVAEHLCPAIVADEIDALGEVVVGVFIVTDAAAGGRLVKPNFFDAVFEPLLDVLVLVVTGVEEARDGRRGQRRPLTAHGSAHAAASQAVDHATVLRCRVLEVLAGLLDDVLGHRDAGILAGTQRLDLGDGHGTLILVMPVDLRGVEP